MRLIMRAPTMEEPIMARKKRTPTQHSQVQRDLRSPLYRMQVVKDKTRYNRKRDKTVRSEDFRKTA